jgi:hypothetical protein
MQAPRSHYAPAGSEDRGHLFRLKPDSDIPIDRGQRSDDRGLLFPSTISWSHDAGFASNPDCLAANFRMLSPFKIRRWALWTSRSRMASATVGLPINSCQ